MKLKIAYEAARRQVSILELFIDSILDRLSRLNEDESFFEDIKHSEQLEEEQYENAKLNPLVVVDKLYRARELSENCDNKVIMDHARLRALMARLRYQRERFEKFLML